LAGEPIALTSMDQGRTRLDPRVEPAQYRHSAGAAEPLPLSPDGFVPRKRRDGQQPASTGAATTAVSSRSTAPARPTEERVATSTSAASQRTPVEPKPAAGLAADELSRQLDQIELDLSLMVAQDRSQWNLAALARRTQSLVESGADPLARGRARLVLEKIRQFESAFEAAGTSAPDASKQAVSSTRQPVSRELADPRYDAQGVLKEVISRKSAKPAAPFAVVDGEGQPLCFVSPSPGLNLNRYLNKPVGLYGRRGYLPELKKPHVVAERVIELDTRLR
jgi:hypothetical protein